MTRTTLGPALGPPLGPAPTVVLYPALSAVLDWTPPVDCSDPRVAFSRCEEISAEFTAHLHRLGIPATWTRLRGPLGHFPHALRQWKGIDQSSWQHFVTKVPTTYGDLYVDFTARQFDPSAAHPLIVPVEESLWDSTHQMSRAALTDYLRRWRAGESAAPRPGL